MFQISSLRLGSPSPPATTKNQASPAASSKISTATNKYLLKPQSGCTNTTNPNRSSKSHPTTSNIDGNARTPSSFNKNHIITQTTNHLNTALSAAFDQQDASLRQQVERILGAHGVTTSKTTWGTSDCKWNPLFTELLTWCGQQKGDHTDSTAEASTTETDFFNSNAANANSSNVESTVSTDSEPTTKLVPISPSIVEAATQSIFGASSDAANSAINSFHASSPPCGSIFANMVNSNQAASRSPTGSLFSNVNNSTALPASTFPEQGGGLMERTIEAKQYFFLDLSGDAVRVDIPAGEELITDSIQKLLDENLLKNRDGGDREARYADNERAIFTAQLRDYVFTAINEQKFPVIGLPKKDMLLLVNSGTGVEYSDNDWIPEGEILREEISALVKHSEDIDGSQLLKPFFVLASFLPDSSGYPEGSEMASEINSVLEMTAQMSRSMMETALKTVARTLLGLHEALTFADLADQCERREHNRNFIFGGVQEGANANSSALKFLLRKYWGNNAPVAEMWQIALFQMGIDSLRAELPRGVGHVICGLARLNCVQEDSYVREFGSLLTLAELLVRIPGTAHVWHHPPVVSIEKICSAAPAMMFLDERRISGPQRTCPQILTRFVTGHVVIGVLKLLAEAEARGSARDKHERQHLGKLIQATVKQSCIANTGDCTEKMFLERLSFKDLLRRIVEKKKIIGKTLEVAQALHRWYEPPGDAEKK